MLSFRVERTDGGIRVSLHGTCEDDEVDLVERLLADLVEGQGNRAVTVAANGLRGVPGVHHVLGRVAALARNRGSTFALDGGSGEPIVADPSPAPA